MKILEINVRRAYQSAEQLRVFGFGLFGTSNPLQAVTWSWNKRIQTKKHFYVKLMLITDSVFLISYVFAE